jgi:hypothetical protein
MNRQLGFKMLICVLFHVWAASTHAQQMNNASLFQILDSVTDSLEGDNGMWHIKYNDRLMLVITDEAHNRMRIISPVALLEELGKDEMEEVLTANFHSTLDVRYALSEGILWVAYIHPLSQLGEDQLRDALLQVYRAAETYGTTYSSSELQFPGSEGVPAERKTKKKM